ncbi:pimeloyl-ACP methyl ester carboxylesterase [Sphingomonas naasensis]|uniref:Alpha/beta hydrolase n=1 Tax=Sphingomonas naasensis TaxID=1344951 RepID=A0A4S1WIF2_9SPHN|nr:alpha/beta hydrolase [Sphingomonas naasensis]NIJ22321.1 pimeloyl-ACP methyl ester carboxylesterase [Sphingomonas naasensis]TGX40676.1 alpha/beta hydrolase [Sphingomonas naasensis]
MSDPLLRRISLATGVALDVAIAGDPAKPAIFLLHGFPESHRTWRHQIPELARDYFVVAPDQRGFARSSKPEGVDSYGPGKAAGDLLALADHLGVGRFTLVGHDWGGAIAWMAALQNPQRVARLIIVNAPHPLVFQRALFDDPAQRKASQYITRFRDTTIDQGLVGAGLERFFASTFTRHLVSAVAGEDKAAYLDEWSQPGAMTAMLNWYRASPIVVPAPDAEPERPAWLDAPFPPIVQPTLVIWGMRDFALLPGQLALADLVPDLTIARIEDGGHFVPWEKPEAVTAAMRKWLAAHPVR